MSDVENSITEQLPPLLVVAGCLNIDLIVQVPALPDRDSRLVAPFTKMLGGMSANLACAAATVGAPWKLRVELISAIGGDAEGQWAEDELNRRGVDTQWLDRTSTTRTHMCMVMVEPQGQRAIVAEPGLLNYSRIGERFEAALQTKDTRHFHVDGYHAPGALDHFAIARVAGWRTSLDVDELLPEDLQKHRFAEIVRDCFDLVFINQKCASQLLATNELAGMRKGLTEIAALTKATFLLTLGAAGVDVIEPKNAPVSIPAIQVETVDTTGAGDVFAGLFLACWLNGLTAVDAAQYAAAGAALSTTELGALGCLPTASAIQAMLH